MQLTTCMVSSFPECFPFFILDRVILKTLFNLYLSNTFLNIYSTVLDVELWAQVHWHCSVLSKGRTWAAFVFFNTSMKESNVSLSFPWFVIISSSKCVVWRTVFLTLKISPSPSPVGKILVTLQRYPMHFRFEKSIYLFELEWYTFEKLQCCGT